MRRIALAALLAGLVLLGSTAPAAANDGPGTFGLGCWGNGLRLWPSIHQHGPLFNYGPYYGYPPFEPYGYWNAYLQYTGPVPPPGGAGGGPGAYGWIHGPNPHTFGNGFPHPLNLGGGGLLHRGGGGILHRGKSTGCSSCGAAEQIATSGNAVDRLNGIGTPAASRAYYAEGPNIITVGFPGR
jgi:hypothetical protein